MATSLLPSAIKASKKTISADSITSVSKSSSSAEKLEGIRRKYPGSFIIKLSEL